MRELNQGWLRFFRILFVISAIWNFAGAIPGLFDTAAMFEREFGRALEDPVMVAVYRGAWGTAFLYGFGFLMAAKDPVRHTGIVLMAGAGKALFALNLFFMHMKGMDVGLRDGGDRRRHRVRGAIHPLFRRPEASWPQSHLNPEFYGSPARQNRRLA